MPFMGIMTLMPRNGNMMKLDFLICGSPNDAFFSQIAFFRLCLNALGGACREARLVAVFGDDEISPLPDVWAPYFANIDVSWASVEAFAEHGYAAQGDRRFELIRDDADIAIMCDADVTILRPIDDLCRELMAEPALAGVIAHYHYRWPGRSERDPDTDWPDLARSILGREMKRPYRYNLEGKDAPPQAPFYVNYGMVAGPPRLLKDFIERDLQIRPSLAEIFGSWLAPQVSLPLTCTDLGIPTRPLPIRFNFPNDPKADQQHPQELENVVFLHFLRTKIFDRQKIFTTRTEFEHFLNMTLGGSNKIFQEHVRRISGGIYPFERGDFS
ncbi:MAG: hypothetical protein CMM50_10035 [Rhodospirillaceae bacterium]|nr:hypothetical protein [Rhodospirillaceae bacterium]|tara:strand:+ start:593 stop:1576 length:984 start_codon:yes stop_codon:yes gene_type:complete